MSFTSNGELVPVGGGDAIPLIRETLTMGRRESCDIRLNFPNVSGMHCELVYRDGYWIVKDMGSTNGIKVNGVRVQKKILHPGDTITIAKRSYTIDYVQTMGKQALEEILEDQEEEIMNQPLLEKAGLVHPPRDEKRDKRTSRRPWEDDDDED